MKRFALLLCLSVCFGRIGSSAEPDWPAVEQHSLDLLRQYVRIASVNPPADTRATAALLSAEFEKAGLHPKLYDSGNNHVNLLVRLAGRDSSKKPLLLLNHMDVVPADRKRWKADPFGASIRDGVLWGRGSLDMKSTGVMQLTALILLKQLGIVPPRDIVFMATCDEESDGVFGASWMIEHHWDELNPEYVLDEGGVGSNDLYATGKTVFGISVADKQVLWLNLRAEGTSGHASQPIPDNANDILLTAIERARQAPPTTKANATVEGMQKAIGDFADNKFMNAIQKNTISLTTLRSGVGDPPKVNVIPSVAEATLDCRLLPGVNADEFVSGIKARVNDPRVTFTRLSKSEDPGPSSTATALYLAVTGALRKVHPDAITMPIIVPYGTDTQKFRKKGVIGYGIMPMVIDTATLATMHSDSEHIPVDQFRQGLHIYFDILSSQY
jgi:acetylornithine deacetylase/succinyl-diaminopimelate desuccinylase-like protein